MVKEETTTNINTTTTTTATNTTTITTTTTTTILPEKVNGRTVVLGFLPCSAARKIQHLSLLCTSLTASGAAPPRSKRILILVLVRGVACLGVVDNDAPLARFGVQHVVSLVTVITSPVTFLG